MVILGRDVAAQQSCRSADRSALRELSWLGSAVGALPRILKADLALPGSSLTRSGIELAGWLDVARVVLVFTCSEEKILGNDMPAERSALSREGELAQRAEDRPNHYPHAAHKPVYQSRGRQKGGPTEGGRPGP